MRHPLPRFRSLSLRSILFTAGVLGAAANAPAQEPKNGAPDARTSADEPLHRGAGTVSIGGSSVAYRTVAGRMALR
ncbi:MAG: hypothetical protein AAGB93_20465, partial [Planctomycetota bacterium]